MVSRIKFVLAAVLALFVTVGVMPSQAYAVVVRNTYIVQTTPEGQDAILKAIFSIGEVPVDQLDLVLDGFTVPLTEYEASVLAARPEVLSIQQDQQMILLETQTPTPSWGLDRIDQQTKAYDNTYNYPVDGGKGVRVYIVDTGVMATNPEFTGRILPGFDALGQNMADTDCHGHGTHVAGTVAGTKFGVAKAATIVPVRVLSCAGSGSTSGILTGLDWILANNPAGTPALVSMSIGGPLQPLFNAGLKKVYDGGILPVVAAGNSNADACRYSPASALDTLAVGASDINDSRASYSNYGDCVDVFAPGSSIVSASATNPAGSATMSGTSMATPHVSGLAALYLGQNPTATPAQISAAIRDNGILNGVNNAQSQFGNILINNNFIRGATPVTPNPNPVLNAPDKVASITVTATTATSGTVSWVDGPSNGGSPITGHVIRALAPGAVYAIANSVRGSVTSYTLNGLDPNTSYTFSVYAYNDIGSGLASAGVVAKTAIGAPAAPLSLVATPGASTAALTWSQVNDGGSPITYYSVETYNPANSTWSLAGTSTSPTYTLSGLTSGTTYLVRVKGSNALGTGVASKSLSFTTIAGAPDVPTGLNVVSVADTKATVAWAPVASTTPNAVVSYIVSFGIIGGLVQHMAASTPSATLTPLAPGRKYSFTVRAQVGTTLSGESTPATFTTSAVVPGAPAGLTVTGNPGSQVLRWYGGDDGGSPITSYVIETSGPLANSAAPVEKWTVFAEQAVTSINLPAAPVGKFVRYRVIAKNVVGVGVPSIAVAITTAAGRPGEPGTLSATEPNSAGLTTLSWGAPATDGGAALSGYTVMVTRDAKTWSTLANVSASVLSFQTQRPAKGQTWGYAVYARNIAGVGPYSNTVTLTTASSVPGAVQGLTLTLTGTEDLTVRWSGVYDNGGLAITGYTLQTLNNGAWSTVAELPATTLTYLQKRPLPGQTVSFRVFASNSLGAGSLSNVGTFTAPFLQASAPQNFTAVYNNSTKRVDVGYSAPSELGGSRVLSYTIQTSRDSGLTWSSLASIPSSSLAASVTAPTKGQSWVYRVVAITGFGSSLPSQSITVEVANSVPAAMSAPMLSLSGTNEFTVRWNAVSDTGGLPVTYNLERQVDGAWASVGQFSATTLSYVITRPAPGRYATFRVTAVNSIGAGPVSAVGSLMSPYAKASAPQNFAATANATTGRVDVSFSAPADLGGGEARSYYVQYSRDGGKSWSTLTTIAGTSTSVATTAPAKGQTWLYRVAAYTQYGLGELSSVVSLSTAATAPSVVNAFSVSLTGTAEVTVRWSAPYDNGGSVITGYLLERQVDGVWTSLGQQAPSTTSFTVARPAPGVYTTFRVTAINAIGSGPVSNPGSVMTPYTQASAPQAFAAIRTTAGVTISYTAPSDLGGGSVRSYSIQVSRDSGATWQNYTSTTGVTVNLSAPAKGQTWQYRAIAVTQYGNSLPSGSASISVATTVPSAPGSISYGFNSDSTVTVRWSAPSDNGGLAITGYKVQKQNGTTWVDFADASVTSIIVPADLPGARSYWRVIALNSLGASSPSSVMSYLIPAIKSTAVQNVAAVSANGAVQVSYSAPANLGGGSFFGYYTYVSKDGGLTWSTVTYTTATTVRAPAPTAGATWMFKVAANTSAGIGVFSPSVSVTG